MPPSFALLRFARRRRLVLPLPLFLLWPLLLLAWVGLGLAWLATSGRPPRGVKVGLTALRAFYELRGTRVDLRGADESLYVRFV